MEIMLLTAGASLVAFLMYMTRTHSEFFMNADKARRRAIHERENSRGGKMRHRKAEMKEKYKNAMYWLKDRIKISSSNGKRECTFNVSRDTPTIPMGQYFRKKGYTFEVKSSSANDNEKIVHVGW